MARQKSATKKLADARGALGVSDTLENMASGIGTMRDKNMQGRFVSRYNFTDQEAEASYEWDSWGRKVVDIPAFDMTREGREWKTEKANIELIEATEERVNYDSKLLEALIYARLYGGSVMVMGINGTGAPETPLVPEQIQKDSLAYIHVLPKSEISTEGRIRDVNDPLFGGPEKYRISVEKTGGQIEIHPSRVVRFTGARAPSRRRTDHWGNSVLCSVYDAMSNAALSSQGVAALINEAKTDVFKVKGLTLKLADKEYADRLVKRYALAEYVKSVINATIMDSEEEWEQKSFSFQSLPDVVRMFLQILSGASDIPVTRFLGETPSGLNSTGESDIRNYYDRIAAEQKMLLKPAQAPVIDAIIRSSLGSRPADVYYQFAPLWQLSEKEKSENNERNAKAAQSYVNSGLIPVDALAKGVANKLVEDGFYPGLDQALDESSEQPGQHKIETREAEAELSALAAAGAANGNQNNRFQQDAEPRTLYVRRNVLNGAEILKWAKAQGFDQTLEASDLHVTIAFSRTPVDWMAVGSDDWGGEENGQMIVKPGGARIVEPLGPKGAIVLLFSSSRLSWRHENIIRAGASWDWPEYQPHVTITYQGKGMDLSGVEPYRGKIVLGPEIFEEVVEDWEKKIKEKAA
jgi:phage-related protein (TIGR01555 family)